MMEPTWATIVHVVWNGRDHIQSTARVTAFERERWERGKERESCSGSVTHVLALRMFLLCLSSFGAHDLVCFSAHVMSSLDLSLCFISIFFL
jgi:hypothetical protein